jgi:hypothetical protein
MVKSTDIGWGKYTSYEGPFFRGTAKFSIGNTYTDNERILAVVTSTEGGAFDAINMYDRCVLSAGLIQWCEAGQYSVSDMLGSVAAASPDSMKPLKAWLENVGADFRTNGRGRWRFFFSDDRGEVDRIEEQRRMFLLRSSGAKGSWDEGSKEYASGWAAAVSNVLSDPGAMKAQVDFTVPRLRLFAMKESLDYVFGEYPSFGSMKGDWPKAAQAAFLSFAANLPATANKMVVEYLKGSPPPKGTKDWAIGLLKQLTFGPNIAIYPHRYNAIRPVLEKLYGVDLPDFADELKAQDVKNSTAIPSFQASVMSTVVEIQRALIKLGFDLGPAGADGKYGTKTEASVMTFQRLHGLKDDGVVGPRTKTALYEVTQ